MKIILLDDIPKLGRRGEVRDVADGFARNFLLPKKLALSATAGNLKNLDHIRKQQDAKAGRIKSDADTVDKIIAELIVTKHSERQLRVIDHDQDGSMELKKREGYF